MNEKLSCPLCGKPECDPAHVRAKWNLLPSRGQVPCPDCGTKKTHPTPGCACPSELVGNGTGDRHIYFTPHLNLNHHTCEDVSRGTP